MQRPFLSSLAFCCILRVRGFFENCSAWSLLRWRPSNCYARMRAKGDDPMNRVRPLSVMLGSFLLIVPFVPAARCELITFAFKGTVTSVSVSPEYQSVDFPDVGDPFTGFYAFDSDAPDTANSPDVGGFTTILLNTALAVSIGEFRFEGQAITIGTFDNYYGVGDFIPSIELTSDPSLAQLLNHNNFSLVIAEDNLFSDPNVLPLTPPSLNGADETSLTMELDDSNDLFPFPEVRFVGMLESLTIVPEPASGMFAVIALISTLQIRIRITRRETRKDESQQLLRTPI